MAFRDIRIGLRSLRIPAQSTEFKPPSSAMARVMEPSAAQRKSASAL